MKQEKDNDIEYTKQKADMLRKVDNASALREHEKKMKNKQNQKDLLSQLDSYTMETQKKALHDRNEDKRLMLEKLNRENEEE